MELTLKFSDFFRGKHKAADEDGRKEAPVFIVKTGVVGSLVIRNLDETLLTNASSRIEVNIEGFMKCEVDTRLDAAHEYRVVFEKKVLSMTQALSITGHLGGDHDNERVYPFTFDLESWLKRDQQNCIKHRAMDSRNNFAFLPPSLRHEIRTTPDNSPRPRAAARVLYIVTARVVANSRSVKQIKQIIHLLPTPKAAPPMCISDFKGEYRPIQSVNLRRSMFSRAGELSVLLKEPKQLSLRADAEQSVAEVPILLRMNLSESDGLASKMPCIEAEVSWRLRLTTFVSLKEQSGPATMKQAVTQSATACVRSSYRMRTMKMVWRKWTPQECVRDVVESEQTLLLAVPRSEMMTPTFWHSYLSRRYSIWVQLKVTNPGTAKIEVEAPIRLGISESCLDKYEQDLRDERSRNNLLIFETGEEDEMLPRYNCI